MAMISESSSMSPVRLYALILSMSARPITLVLMLFDKMVQTLFLMSELIIIQLSLIAQILQKAVSFARVLTECS